jgi:AmmeMemoRadiSam system protein A
MPISVEDRAKLVELAKAAIAAEVGGKALPSPEDLPGILGETRGCFVTLTNEGRLRGCIGTFHPDRPLGQMIVEMAAAAANDPRFASNPVTLDELPRLKIEVSVLSPLEETSTPADLQIGTHGIFVVRGGRAGCFLPEVATDMGWNAQEFLDQCCTGKAGLPPGAWRMQGTKVFLFTSEKFDH